MHTSISLPRLGAGVSPRTTVVGAKPARAAWTNALSLLFINLLRILIVVSVLLWPWETAE